MMDGFKKVAQDGGTYVVATFYNPETKEVKTKCVRDYDYADCSRDDDDLYCMPIDEQACRDYKHYCGMILQDDLVEVVKGRKVPIGTQGRVVKIRQVNDRYGRWVADYVDLDNGYSTNVANCKMIGG